MFIFINIAEVMLKGTMEITFRFNGKNSLFADFWSGWNPRHIFFPPLIHMLLKSLADCCNPSFPATKNLHYFNLYIFPFTEGGECGGSRRGDLLFIGRDYFKKWKLKAIFQVEKVTYPLSDTLNKNEGRTLSTVTYIQGAQFQILRTLSSINS